MFLKIIISIFPLVLFVGVGIFTIVGFDSFMGSGMGSGMMQHSVGAIPDMSHMGGAMNMPSFMNPEIIEKLSGVSMGSAIFLTIATLSGIVIIMLASAALFIAITRSVVLDQPLDTSIFSKLFDRDILRVFYVYILMLIAFGAIITGIFFLAIMVHMSLSILGLFVIYLLLRVQLILYGVALGDINSVSEAFSKTKGNVWNVFKVFVLSIIVIIIFQIISGLLGFGVGLIGGKISMVLSGIVMFISVMILIPLGKIADVSFAYLYKAIR